MNEGGERRLGPLLLFGMLTVAPLCCWIFLRRGYSPSLRRTAFWYTGIQAVIPLIGRLGS